ncbi:MAG: hypothetical protein MI976_07500 [Pseudomonadales bacterium]|nr:hypothetical protein [Pseudomonadales bacterium]
MPYIQQLRDQALEEIDDDEDDIGPCYDEAPWEPLGTGASNVAYTKTRAAKDVYGWGNLVAGQAISRTGNVASVANFVQTGSFLSTASTGVSAALAPVVAVTGPIGIAMALVDAGLSGYSAYKTKRHMDNLNTILERGHNSAMPGTCEAIIFILKKKNRKFRRKGLGCVPILGSVITSTHAGFRSIKKRLNKTRGVERRFHAKTLWDNHICGDPIASQACRELLGDKIFYMIQNLADGDQVLKKKIRSL